MLPPGWLQLGPNLVSLFKNKIFKSCGATIFTDRQQSLQRLCFYTCLSVHRGGGIPACLAGDIPHALQVSRGAVYPSMPCRFPGPHPGESLRGLDGGGGLQANTRIGLQAHTWGYCCRRYASYWNAFLFF